MIPTTTGLIVIVIGIWCQFSSFHKTLTWTVLLTLFEAADAADLPALGGASVTPVKLFLPFLILRVVSMRGGFASIFSEIAPRRVLFLYLLLLIWAIPSGIILPRLFEGAFDVNSLERTVIDGGQVPLHPSSGNITQSIYATGSFVIAVCVSVLSRKTGGYATLLKALLMLTGLNIGLAVTDLVTAATHTGFLLDIFHTGSYAFLTQDETNGLKRISGSFSEASAFASFSLALLGVNVSLYLMRVKERLTGLFSVLLSVLLLLSTSSTAYVSLAVFASALIAYAAWSLVALGNARALKAVAKLVSITTFLVLLTILFFPDFATAAWKMVDSVVLSKGQSESAQERGALNIQASKIFLETYGIGAGLGATRTSNYIYLLASNLGAIGLVLFAALIGVLTFVRTSGHLLQEHRKIVIAARVGLLGSLVPAALIATIFDLGPLFYILVGITASGAMAPRQLEELPRRNRIGLIQLP